MNCDAVLCQEIVVARPKDPLREQRAVGTFDNHDPMEEVVEQMIDHIFYEPTQDAQLKAYFSIIDDVRSTLRRVKKMDDVYFLSEVVYELDKIMEVRFEWWKPKLTALERLIKEFVSAQLRLHLMGVIVLNQTQLADLRKEVVR